MNTLAWLKIGPISYVPFDNYQKDFTFIVNKEEYHTNKIVADLLSKKISKIHLTDPTFDQYEIITEYPGNFQLILDLLKENNLNINHSELPFFAEIIEILDIDINIKHDPNQQLTLDNVLNLIHLHEKYEKYYYNFLNKEIEFVSKNFYKLKTTHEDSLLSLSPTTIQCILSNKNLYLENEDQLLDFVNKLYISDSTLNFLYEYVNFSNVSCEALNQFSSIFNTDDLTQATWNCILKSLLNKTKVKQSKDPRYSINRNDSGYLTCTNFVSIFDQLRQTNKINTFVKTTFSSDGCGFDVRKIIQNNNTDFSFYTRDIPNSWICFKFNKCQVSVSEYKIRSDKWNKRGGNHPRSWVIEGLIGNTWEVIDSRVNDSTLNGAGNVGTFLVQRNTIFYDSIRMMLTDTNWNNKNYLILNSFELFGSIRW